MSDLSTTQDRKLIQLDPKTISIPGHWIVHSYYTLNPWAPDGSGRLLVAGANLATNIGKVFVLSQEGQVLDSFGETPVTESFWHTGFWQTWSPDAQFVYFQSGSLKEPQVTKRALATGQEIIVKGDLEGMPLSGEPGITCNHGMLYAAGYSSGVYEEKNAVVPFQARNEHGIYKMTFNPPQEKLLYSINQILALHPKREELAKADEIMRERLGAHEGLTLMAYCVRWNAQGTRFLFYFGNHCVAKDREEPRIAYIFTAKRDLSDLQLALDISFENRGVHWGWHPDGEQLIGYGPLLDSKGQPIANKIALSLVRYDGQNFRNVSRHASGGHPTICPSEPRLAVSDESSLCGRIVFIDIENDVEVASFSPGRVNGEIEPKGRNPFRVCHHPVFSEHGETLLFNTLVGDFAQVATIDVGPVIERLRRREHL